ncbi:hypothetical protein ACLMJK_004989 [Lecanora helva]
MAIFPNSSSSAQQTVHAHPINIQEWTEQATQSLNAVSLQSPVGTRGTSVSLAIDLDENAASKQEPNAEAVPSGYRPRREPLRRDSLKRREALLKGKEGSRRRTRWENDRLLNNPWAQPPLPTDWEVHPTYPKHSVPYYLAPLWDQDMAARAEVEKENRDAARKRAQATDASTDKISREVREKLKKAKAAKGLLKDLEEQVRNFVQNWEATTSKRPESPELDSEDEEIVFVGRNGQMNDMPSSPKSKPTPDERDAERDRLVFESLANDQGASFGWVPFDTLSLASRLIDIGAG